MTIGEPADAAIRARRVDSHVNAPWQLVSRSSRQDCSIARGDVRQRLLLAGSRPRLAALRGDLTNMHAPTLGFDGLERCARETSAEAHRTAHLDAQPLRQTSLQGVPGETPRLWDIIIGFFNPPITSRRVDR